MPRRYTHSWHPSTRNIHMATAERYREITASGSPRDIGRQIGELARGEIQGFAEIALARVNKTIAITRDRALEIAARSADYAARYSPTMVEELRGMSEASGVSFEDLMLLQVRNQLKPETAARTLRT